MQSKEMKDELRKLRKEAMKPVSKMKKNDMLSEIESLKMRRENTPPVASTPSEKNPKMMMPKITDLKEAKENGFPTKPVDMQEKMKALRAKKGSGKVQDTKKAPMSKKDKLAKLMAMLDEDSE